MRLWSKLKTKICTLGVALLLITAPCFAFDKNLTDEAKAKFETQLVKPDSYYTFVRIEANGTAEALYPDIRTKSWVKAETYWKQEGSGTVLLPGLVLTAAHVVEPDMVTVTHSPVGVFTTWPLKILSTTVLIRDYKSVPQVAWVTYIDRDRDIALLRYVPHGFLEPLISTYGIDLEVNGHKLKKGDQLAIVVHKRNKDERLDCRVEMKWGTVVRPGPTSFDEDMIAWLSTTDFTMDVLLQKGDSGSLVFAFDDGKPVFIGVARALQSKGPIFFSYAAWIGQIIGRILSIS